MATVSGERGGGGSSRGGASGTSGKVRRSPWEGALALAIAGVVFGAALAFGAVHNWASALVEIALWLLLVASGVLRRGLETAPRLLRIATVLLFAYLAAQFLPLPRAVVAILSPAAEEIYRHTVDPLSGWVRDGVAMTAPAVEAAEAGAPAEWRSLALYPFAAKRDWLRYLSYAVVITLAALCRRPALCLRALVGVGAAVAFVAMLQAVSWNGRLLWVFAPYDTGVVLSHPRLTGPFVNSDQLATFLQLILAPGIALWLRHRALLAHDEQWRGLGTILFLTISIMLVGAALLGTASRAGITGAGLSLLVLWAWRPVAPARSGRKNESRVPEPSKRWWHRVVPALVALAMILMSLQYAGSKALDTLDERVGRSDWRADLEVRMTLWAETLDVIRDFPLFGVGAGSWREAVTRYQRYPDVGYLENHAHNDFVEWAAEVGIAGLILSALVAVGLLRWAATNRAMSPVVRSGIVGSLLGVAWHEVFDFSLRSPANACLLAALVGLACNRNWRRCAAVPSPRATAWLPVGVPVGAAIAAVLLVASIAQFRESLLWIRARGGALDSEARPSDAETWRFFATNRLNAAPGDVTPVIALLRETLVRRPTDALAFRELASIAVDPRVRRETLEAALFLSPTRGLWRASLAAMFDAAGDEERALAEIEKATYLDPISIRHPYLDMAHHLDASVVAAAERGFARALEEHSQDWWLLFSVGSFHFRFENWREAAELYERAAEADGNWGRFGSLAGRVRARAGQYAEAEGDLKRAIAAAPDVAASYQHLAVEVLKPQGKLEEAVTILTSGIHRAHPRILLLLALYDVQRARGDRRAALAALSEAADLQPRDANFRFRLGVAYLDDGDSRRAARAFQRAIRLDGSRAVFHASYARALERENDLMGARLALRRALALEPGNSYYAALLKNLDRR